MERGEELDIDTLRKSSAAAFGNREKSWRSV